jgi:hypothetical protein
MKGFFVWMSLSFCAAITFGQAPVIHARLEPAKGIIVGQPIHLVVEVLVPNFFTGSPDFPTFELENVIVVLPEETPQNLNEEVNGQRYAGIRRTYFLYPQQPGDFRLPPTQLTVPYASTPPKTTVAHLALPPLTFHADIPEAARSLSYFLPTTQLTMQQKWSSSLSKLRVGDTVERTITVTTIKMQGMLIPPLSLEAPAGIRIYPAEPKVQDQKTDRGEFVFGRRTQSAKYFIQKEGDYTLPAIELKWWNLSTNRVDTATLPAAHFIAAANPDYVAELPPEPEPVISTQPKPPSLWIKYRFWIRVVAPLSIAVLLLAWLGFKYFPRLYTSLKARRKQYRYSEAAYFHNLVRACHSDDAAKAYQWLLQWQMHFGLTKTLDQFLEQIDDDELTRQVNSLTATLYASAQTERWTGQTIAKLLKKHRKTQSLQPPERTRLPLLNPSESSVFDGTLWGK